MPLDTELTVEPDGDGAAVRDGETLVATVEPAAELALETPETVSVGSAREATRRYRGLAEGEFRCCFVCGRARADALGVFAGEVEGRDVVASPWIPPEWTAARGDDVRSEIAAAVLDCPTFFAAYLGREVRLSYLVRFQVRIGAPIVAGEEHVVIAWPIGADGRKLHAGSAVLSADGEPLAVARALLVEQRSE